jgi:ABC-2 type transport system ATP-binding protein
MAALSDCKLGQERYPLMGITFNQVHFSFNGLRALENIRLSLGEGITAVMGPNGAGKTTLLKLAASILTPCQGEMLFEGEPYATSDARLRSTLGFLPQSVDFPEHLTPRKLITYLAQLRFLDPWLGMQELERLGISSQADRCFGTLSMGEIQLVGIAQAVMGAPRLLVLDEPFRGLDVLERGSAFRAIQAPTQSRIVVLSTHVPNEVELLATQVVILLEGRVIYSGSIEELRREASGQVYEICLSHHAETPFLAKMCISRRSEMDGKTILRVVGQVPSDVKVNLVEPTLEDAYLLLIRRASYQADCSKEANQ